jgi:hypothetical protein
MIPPSTDPAQNTTDENWANTLQTFLSNLPAKKIGGFVCLPLLLYVVKRCSDYLKGFEPPYNGKNGEYEDWKKKQEDKELAIRMKENQNQLRTTTAAPFFKNIKNEP